MHDVGMRKIVVRVEIAVGQHLALAAGDACAADDNLPLQFASGMPVHDVRSSRFTPVYKGF
jgi:hypothetical protein